MLCVDTFDKWTGLRGDAENKTGEILAALEPLQNAAAAGLAVVISADQRKAQGSHGDAVRGSNALAGGVDVVLELERSSVDLSSSVRVLKAVSRYEETPEELTAELTETGYTASESVSALRAKSELDRVAAAVERLAGARTSDAYPTVEELSESVDLPKSTVRERLGVLQDAGRIQRCGSGKRNDAYRYFPFDSTDGDLLGRRNKNGAGQLEENRQILGQLRGRADDCHRRGPRSEAGGDQS